MFLFFVFPVPYNVRLTLYSTSLNYLEFSASKNLKFFILNLDGIQTYSL